MKTQAYLIDAQNYGPEPVTRARAAELIRSMRRVRRWTGRRVTREVLPGGVYYTQDVVIRVLC